VTLADLEAELAAIQAAFEEGAGSPKQLEDALESLGERAEDLEVDRRQDFRTSPPGEFSQRTLERLLDAGISVAAINHRYTRDTKLPGAFDDSRRALQFLRSKATEWNIDKERVGASGASAGAQIAMYLAFHDEMANPDASDPVARESTRLAAVANDAGQTALIQTWWEQWIPGYTVPPPGGDLDVFDQPWGATSQAALDEKKREVGALANISADDPPIFMTYGTAPDDPVPERGAGLWKVHHVMFGVKLKEKMDQLGVEATLLYPGAPRKYENLGQFFIEKLGSR
jgi:acetyl esterase/lipase